MSAIERINRSIKWDEPKHRATIMEGEVKKEMYQGMFLSDKIQDNQVLDFDEIEWGYLGGLWHIKCFPGDQFKVAIFTGPDAWVQYVPVMVTEASFEAPFAFDHIYGGGGGAYPNGGVREILQKHGSYVLDPCNGEQPTMDRIATWIGSNLQRARDIHNYVVEMTGYEFNALMLGLIDNLTIEAKVFEEADGFNGNHARWWYYGAAICASKRDLQDYFYRLYGFQFQFDIKSLDKAHLRAIDHDAGDGCSPQMLRRVAWETIQRLVRGKPIDEIAVRRVFGDTNGEWLSDKESTFIPDKFWKKLAYRIRETCDDDGVKRFRNVHPCLNKELFK